MLQVFMISRHILKDYKVRIFFKQIQILPDLVPSEILYLDASQLNPDRASCLKWVGSRRQCKAVDCIELLC